MLALHGAAVIDADAASRQTTAAGGAAIARIRELFGEGVLTPQGALDRNAMRQRVFDDPTARSQLEAIVHPLVQSSMVQQVDDAQTRGARVVVLDIPLLVETGRWRPTLDRILVVDCSAPTQMQRVAARDQLEQAQIASILNAQAPRRVRLAAADCVLCNDGITLQALSQAVAALAKQFGL